jgi:hypothetical protein
LYGVAMTVGALLTDLHQPHSHLIPYQLATSFGAGAICTVHSSVSVFLFVCHFFEPRTSRHRVWVDLCFLSNRENPFYFFSLYHRSIKAFCSLVRCISLPGKLSQCLRPYCGLAVLTQPRGFFTLEDHVWR